MAEVPKAAHSPRPADFPEAADSAKAADAPSDAALETLWQRVLDAWHDDKSHGALLDFALRAQALAAVAAHYRALADDPEKGARARQKLDGVAAAATSLMLSTRTPRVHKVPRSITFSAFGTCAVLLAWLAWALWGSR